jgi:putative flippase GtrA
MQWVMARADGMVAVLVRRLGVPAPFVRFGFVGCFGFCWDTGTVYATRFLVGIYAAGALGFLVAASANWVLNRWWTFRDASRGAMHVQWLRFLVVNSAGFAVNRGLFFTLVAVYPIVRHQPILGIMAGSLAGLVINYFLSKTFVFR